jgi:hypothetical protein
VGVDNGTYVLRIGHINGGKAKSVVPLVGGITYVRTGVMKWFLGGVLMGGAYMVCGTSLLAYPILIHSSRGKPTEN